ncbi:MULTISPECIES: tubulin/FtsZ family protein [Halostella]|uniref:tubulin/FtsZ family protein n=1 Tax=Halostella TaxID=1843185 RepID=UPI001081C24A|nr:MULTISPECIES: tubulin/FtsZ family protein [Halostella]
MKLALIAVGQAGGKIVDEFLAYEQQADADFITAATAINTARPDLEGLDYVPVENRVLIGQSRVGGHGVGADNELGAEIAAEESTEIVAATDDVPVSHVDAFLVVAALGGGTGSGAGPVIAKELKRVYTTPVYGLGILPASDEGGIYTLNAARSFQTFVREVDNLLVFDNDAWRKSGETLTAGYDEINEEIARRFGVLFSAGETNTDDAIAESVVDASEIVNTLKANGVSTVGYASEELTPEEEDPGLLSRFTGGSAEPDPSEAENRINSLIRKATLGRLTLPCDVDSAERSLTVVAGPPEHLSRKGIEEGRRWLEEETGSMEVRGGDYPLQSDSVAAAVLLSGVTEVPRVTKLQIIANETQENIEETTQGPAQAEEQLIGEQGEDLDPLF